MSDGIKRMLAERESVKGAQMRSHRLDEAEERLFAIIDRASVFIDEGAAPDKWLPSTILKIGYYVISTSQHPGSLARAAGFVEAMLERARQRYKKGLHPNPFLNQEAA